MTTTPRTSPAAPTSDWVNDLLHGPTRAERAATGEAADLAGQLAAAHARENDLLNRASAAHTDGWNTAAVQAAALLAAAYATAPTDQVPGLLVASGILRGLPTFATATTAHRLDVAITPGVDSLEWRIACTAPGDGPCRESCEGRPGGDCARACTCDATLVDNDHCLPAADLADHDPAALFYAYRGPSRPFISGPIVVAWDGDDAGWDGGGWSWMYAADLPDGVTPDDWEAPR